jgi:hypothetical protein
MRGNRGGNRRSWAGRRLVPNGHSAHGSQSQRPGLQAAAPFHLGGRGTAARRRGAAGTEAVSRPAPRSGRPAAPATPRGRGGTAAAPSPARRAQAGSALLLTRV